jgi:HEAT repeat protein
MDLLNQHDAAPTQVDFETLGSGVEMELMAIAEDAEVPSSRRSRAVTALQWFPSVAVRAFLVGKTSADTKAILRRKAVYALAGGWGVEALPELTLALADADVQVRISAVNAMAQLDDAAVVAALQERVSVETVDSVKLALTKAVGGK